MLLGGFRVREILLAECEGDDWLHERCVIRTTEDALVVCSPHNSGDFSLSKFCLRNSTYPAFLLTSRGPPVSTRFGRSRKA